MTAIERKIADETEANAIIERVNQLIQMEKRLTERDEADYLFAKVLLKEIRKRKQTINVTSGMLVAEEAE